MSPSIHHSLTLSIPSFSLFNFIYPGEVDGAVRSSQAITLSQTQTTLGHFAAVRISVPCSRVQAFQLLRDGRGKCSFLHSQPSCGFVSSFVLLSSLLSLIFSLSFHHSLPALLPRLHASAIHFSLPIHLKGCFPHPLCPPSFLHLCIISSISVLFFPSPFPLSPPPYLSVSLLPLTPSLLHLISCPDSSLPLSLPLSLPCWRKPSCC